MLHLTRSPHKDIPMPSAWANGRHLAQCRKVIQETHDVKTFCFNLPEPTLFFFKPGQFVTLELEIAGQQVMRSYTLSSSPSRPYGFSITVKRVPGGEVSNWLHDNVREGGLIAVHGPVGRFNCIDDPAQKVLLLSGGVGITPLMSMARWLCDTHAEVDMVFAHSARTPGDIIYRAELDDMSGRSDRFKLHLICERTAAGQAWSGYRGYLTREMLQLIAPDFVEREIFCCGPAPYMQAVRQLLQASGYDFSHYHEESFEETPAEPAKADKPDEAAQGTHCVSFIPSGKSAQVGSDTTLLAAAAKAGITIPKACGMGICGTCRVKVLEGETEMNHNGGITEEEMAEGYVLSCCTMAKSNLSVEY